MTNILNAGCVHNSDLTKEQFNNQSIIAASVSADVDAASTARAPTLKLVDTLQNLLMHLFISAQARVKVYDKLSDIGPSIRATKLMSSTVLKAGEYKLSHPAKRTEKSNDIVFKVDQRAIVRTCLGILGSSPERAIDN